MGEKDDYRIISSLEMAHELDQIEEMETKIMSNFSSLDKATDGFVGGELIVISGPTKNGKTLFAQSLTNEFTKQNSFPLWFSYEVTPKYFFRAFPELPLFYLPRRLKMNALDWVIMKCLESFRQYHTRIIFIDHLHYLFDIARVKSPSIEIGTVIRNLKMLSVKMGFIVFLICHTKKNQKEDEKLSYDSIRDSSFVSQESDCVLMIARDYKIENKAWLSIEFHRRTGVLHKKIPLMKIDGYLRELEK